MNQLVEVARKHKNKVVIGHVLRYTDFYRAIKNHVLNGEIGKIISIIIFKPDFSIKNRQSHVAQQNMSVVESFAFRDRSPHYNLYSHTRL